MGRPGITKSHMCVDWTLHPLGKLIVIGFVVICLLSTSMPSMMKIDVAPVLAIASCVAVVITFSALCVGIPKRLLAAVTKEGALRFIAGAMYILRLQFDVKPIVSSLSPMMTTFIIWVGYKENSIAETKSLILYAIFSAPLCQKRATCAGNIVLWIPFVQTWG
jgi:hypothetical protein